MKIFTMIMMIIQLGINPETARIYPMTAEVIGFNYEDDLVTVVNGSENYFSFYGIEDWQLGDLVSIMMVDPGTPGILDDDVILLHWYTGITMEIPEAMPDEYPILTCGE